METLISITNNLSVFALLAFVALIVLAAKEGNDERASLLGYKLFRFLFVFLLSGLSLIIFYTGWVTIDYVLLRVCLTTLMSVTMFAALIYWMIIRRTI